MLGRTIVLAAMIAAAAAVILASREGAARAFTAGCSASNVEYSPYTRGPLDPGLRRLPRITASIGRDRLEGFLFYYPSSPWGKERLRDARIYAGGEDPHGRYATKILWRAQSHLRTRWLIVAGRQIDGDGTFRQGFRGYGYFPSIINVPQPGCWQLSVQVGSGRWTVTFLAA